MKKPTNDITDPDLDEKRARESYRSISAERAPPHLDNRVLKLAADEARKDARFRWFIPWLRPAAFAATVGLSLAVLLEINNEPASTNGVIADETEVAPSARVLDDFASAAADSSSRIREIGATAAERELDGESDANLYVRPESRETPPFCDDEQSATPDAWQRCIERLRAEGRTREADSELARYRNAYPDSPFPED